jgi:bacillithiol biosynthesis deacetylase BshB1
VANGLGLDLLCVAAHPDDAELGLGGTLARMARRGRRVGVLDLTRGELATNGTPEQRLREAGEAAAVLGLAERRNLGLADRGIGVGAGLGPLVAALRSLRPAVVCAPCADDPHPDHAAAWRLTVEACYSARLLRVPGGEPWRVRALLQYPVDAWPQPSLLVDVSEVYEVKWRAISAHRSQFGQGGAPTRLNDGTMEAQVRARDRFWGGHLGVAYAEALVLAEPVDLAALAVLVG